MVLRVARSAHPANFQHQRTCNPAPLSWPNAGRRPGLSSPLRAPLPARAWAGCVESDYRRGLLPVRHPVHHPHCWECFSAHPPFAVAAAARGDLQCRAQQLTMTLPPYYTDASVLSQTRPSPFRSQSGVSIHGPPAATDENAQELLLAGASPLTSRTAFDGHLQTRLRDHSCCRIPTLNKARLQPQTHARISRSGLGNPGAACQVCTSNDLSAHLKISLRPLAFRPAMPTLCPRFRTTSPPICHRSTHHWTHPAFT